MAIKIVWPENDPIAVAEMAKVIKQETKHSQIDWIPNVGHFPMLEAPELWVEKIISSINNPIH